MLLLLRMRRFILGGMLGAALLLVAATDAPATILYSSATRNTTAPSVENGLAAWNLEATWGYYMATPIDPTHFIAARHIGGTSSTITFQGTTYQVNLASRVEDVGSDLAIYTLASGTFPAYAPLYDAAVDGSEIGKSFTVIGRGTQRGAAVYVNSALKGWQWGTADYVQSWGRNVVDGFVDFGPTNDSILYFDFNSDGIANEATLSVGDSSGAIFINVNGLWKLAGINYGVDGPFSLTGSSSDPGFNAAIFDARGLYYKNEQNVWTLVPRNLHDPVPASSYASRISARLDWILAQAPGAVVPEPGSLVLLVAAALAFFGRLRRRPR